MKQFLNSVLYALQKKCFTYNVNVYETKTQQTLSHVLFSTPSWRVDKAVRNYSVYMGIWWQITFKKLNLTQFAIKTLKY